LAVFCFAWFRKTKNIIFAANFILLIYALLVAFSAVYLGQGCSVLATRRE